jgi:hypothetical protein
VLLMSFGALGQTNAGEKQYNKDGLIFSYPSALVLEDTSDNDAQQLTLSASNSEAQIRVFVFRPLVNTPARLDEAKRVLVDPYVNSFVKQFEAMGAKPERVVATSEIAKAPAEGAKVQAVLDGDPGAAEVYWGVIGQRLVVLTFFGPDKARKQLLSGWDSVRNTLKVDEPKATQPAKNPA